MRKNTLIASAIKRADWPTSQNPDIALAGRSNSGKSSLINAIIGTKQARTSSRPGKTILINFYDYMNKVILSDLPGYGYAKVSLKTRSSWKGIIEDYLIHRPNLIAVFILADVRRGIEQEEYDLASWLNISGIPFYFIFTKVDKLSSNELIKQKKLINSTIVPIKNKLLKDIFYVSTLKKSGIEDIKTILNNLGGI